MVAVLEEARALGELAKTRLEAEAHHHLRRLGRRGAGRCSARPSGPRPTPTSSPPTPPSTSTRTATPAASSTSAARTAWRPWSTRSRRDVAGSREGDQRPATASIAQRDPERHARGADRQARHAAVRDRAAGLGLGLHPLPPAPRDRRAQHRLRRRGGVRAVPLGLRLFDHFTRFVDPDFAYGVTLAKTGGRTVLRLADADVLPFELRRASAARIGSYVDEVAEADRHPAQGARRSATGGSTTRSSRGGRTRPDLGRRRKRLEPCPTSTSRRCQNAVAAPEGERRRSTPRRAPRPPRRQGAAGRRSRRAERRPDEAERALTRRGRPAAPRLVRSTRSTPRASTPATASRPSPPCARRSSSATSPKRRRRSPTSPRRSTPTRPRSRRRPPRWRNREIP